MFQLHGESKYIDVLERTLYNGFLSGVGMDGKSFFYTNAMEIKNHYKHRDMEAERSGWFPCSCCPTNVVRLMPSIPGYVYAVKGDALYINLFAKSTSTISVNNKVIQVIQENNYPWEGALQFTVNPKSAGPMKILMRIPGWAQNQAVPSDLYTFKDKAEAKIPITINGKAIDYAMENGYAVLSRVWKKGDVINVTLPMEARKIVSNGKLEDNVGKVAIQRGPLVYCAEWADNNGQTSNLILPSNTTFTAEARKDLFNGVYVLRSSAVSLQVSPDKTGVTTKNLPFVAIPYYAWANRGKGEMQIWFPEQITGLEILSR
jgi:DUF1680 family protein